jgi:hypothetical protein
MLNMSENIREIFTRICNKHDLEVNWLNNPSFVPLQGELIIYDCEVDTDGNTLELPSNRAAPYTYERLKIGDGFTLVNDLPFVDESIIVDSKRVSHGSDFLFDILENYVLSIDYDTMLAFDTSELVAGTASTTAVLGQAILGQMILA